jgi:outer membrane immunogenic protein
MNSEIRIGVRSMKFLLAAAVLTLATPVAAQDWTGFYGVLGAANNSGALDELDSGALTGEFDLDGNTFGLGVGYNVQRGALVYGGEFAFSSGEISVDGVDAANFVDGIVDLKGRIGYATGSVLFYGTLGYAMADLHFASAPTADASGFSYGVGVDMMVTDRIFGGIEYQRRSLDVDEGDIVGFPTYTYKHDVDSIALRIGMRF